ncbi:hypothetical protein OAJ19_03165 [Pelagibacteraceae bacterium]|nr:hypothetical protein [Pelagibacteraceae bacterium]
MLKKLIIVDDDTHFRERLGRSMEKKGFFVETFASYEDCLKRCFEESFDYAVVDMRLEDGSVIRLKTPPVKNNNPTNCEISNNKNKKVFLSVRVGLPL